MKLNFKKLGGLIPAIIQDVNTQQVLMLGFMNAEAFEQTKKTKKVTFYSRTRKKLWTKGETSGNFLEVIKIIPDCDNDTILILANPIGNTCHTGEYSCFGEEEFSLKKLEKIIQKRKKEMPAGSYTTELFKKGLDRITQKVGEEATEVVIASKNRDKKKLKEEVSDLIYHLLVLLTEKKITIEDIEKTLKKRHE